MLYNLETFDLQIHPINDSMTRNDIDVALAMFKQALKEQPDAFAIEGANPIEQNAYVSSGEFAGVYFPNSAITLAKEGAYNVTCLCMIGGYKPCLVLNLKDDYKTFHNLDATIAVTLESVFTSRAEKEARKELERYAREYCNEIYALTNIKRAYKKDGKPFARLADNFPDLNISIDHHYTAHYIYSVKIGGNIGINGQYVSGIRIAYYDAEQKKENITPDEIVEGCAKTVITYKAHLAMAEKQLKAMHRAFLKAEKAALSARKAIQSIPECQDGGTYSSLGYKVSDYAEHIIRYGF